jgi:hypothetical protein
MYFSSKLTISDLTVKSQTIAGKEFEEHKCVEKLTNLKVNRLV